VGNPVDRMGNRAGLTPRSKRDAVGFPGWTDDWLKCHTRKAASSHRSHGTKRGGTRSPQDSPQGPCGFIYQGLSMTDRYALPGSDRREIRPHGVVHPACHPDERIGVTVRLANDGVETMRAVSMWLLSHDIASADLPDGQKLLKVFGNIKNYEKAFGVKLEVRESADSTHRDHYGPITIPAQLAPLISSVHGLDDRKVASPRLKKSIHRAFTGLDGELMWHGVSPHVWGFGAYKRPPGTFLPTEVAEAYQFPAGDGEGQVIGLIELGGGYRPADLKAYWQYLGIEGPTVTSVGVNGAKNKPGSDADSEVVSDIEVSGAIAPKATIACYFGGNTARDFLDCFSQAIHDDTLKPSVISCSWGGPETTWSDAEMTAFDQVFQEAAAKGITILVASGDDGSSDGVTDGKPHVDFPASSPSVTGVGGTSLVATGSTVTSEVVWNDGAQGGAGGGGCSGYFKRAPYQDSLAVCDGMQGVPDCAAVADPNTGFVVKVDGRFSVIGGTSLAAPTIAGLIARVNQLTGKRVGSLSPILYAHPEVCREITVGNNGSFSAGSPWNACTGLGVIDGTKLLAVVK
jgi:kumamolisin